MMKKLDVVYRERIQHNNQVSEKITTLAKNLEVKMKKRDALKSQLERMNKMVNLPSVQEEKMVSRVRFRCKFSHFEIAIFFFPLHQVKLKMENQQLTDKSIELDAKSAENDAKIMAQRLQKEKILKAMDEYKEFILKAQQKCDAFEKKTSQLQDQLGHMEAERADLSNFPAKLQSQKIIIDEVEREVASLKSELRQLKPEQHPVPAKVSSISEI